MYIELALSVNVSNWGMKLPVKCNYSTAMKPVMSFGLDVHFIETVGTGAGLYICWHLPEVENHGKKNFVRSFIIIIAEQPIVCFYTVVFVAQIMHQFNSIL